MLAISLMFQGAFWKKVSYIPYDGIVLLWNVQWYPVVYRKGTLSPCPEFKVLECWR